jgi:putative transposase
MLAGGVALSYETIRRSGISAHFRPRRHLLSVTEWRTEMADRFAVWSQVTAPDAAA